MMKKYLVTVESKEYNPIKHEWEDKQFSGEFEASNAKDAKSSAKEAYADDLDTEPGEIKIIKCEQFIEIKTTEQFNEIRNLQVAKEIDTRDEVTKVVEKLKAEHKSYTIFSLQYEEGWYITYGIKWANNIGYYVLEGNYMLPNDIDA